ncbi:MAG: hypothetical protein P8Z68_11590 [Kineosporiaceae bacterium]
MRLPWAAVAAESGIDERAARARAAEQLGVHPRFQSPPNVLDPIVDEHALVWLDAER